MSEPQFFLMSRDADALSWNYVLHNGVHMVSEVHRQDVIRWCRAHLGDYGENWGVLDNIFFMNTADAAMLFKMRWL